MKMLNISTCNANGMQTCGVTDTKGRRLLPFIPEVVCRHCYAQLPRVRELCKTGFLGRKHIHQTFVKGPQQGRERGGKQGCLSETCKSCWSGKSESSVPISLSPSLKSSSPSLPLPIHFSKQKLITGLSFLSRRDRSRGKKVLLQKQVCRSF